jgi:flavin reductase (DIM6/NTAB) family NADH-FMN oxidoreductase RutF
MEREAVDFGEIIQDLYEETRGDGVLLTSVGTDGRPNVMTIGWGLYGWFYHGHPVAVAAVRPACHTHTLLAQVPQFTLSIPTSGLADEVLFCGTESGRDVDKFAQTGLTPVPWPDLKAPAIRECPVNLGCRIYHAEDPPHGVLTPEHREKPLSEQHTIYYAEVLEVCRWASEDPVA